jgi:hypothetical protein
MLWLLAPILAAASPYTNSCAFGGQYVTGWISVSGVVALFAMILTILIYTIANILPVTYREKLRGISRYEAAEIVLTLFIIAGITGLAAFSCNLGTYIAGATVNYANPMQYAEYTIQNLLFSKALSLWTELYAESVNLVIAANIMDLITSIPITIIQNFVGFDLGHDVIGIYFAFSSVLNTAYAGIIVVTFGILYVLMLFLDIIQSIALTLIVPVAILIRFIPFAGPRLKEASNSFIAIAISFYFIFPLTIIMNGFIMTWLYTPCTPLISICNPYPAYVLSPQLTNLPVASLFSSAPAGGTNFAGQQLPYSSFISLASSGLGGYGSTFSNLISILFNLNGVLIGYGYKIAAYAFQGIVLVALDIAITVGFAQGLSNGFGSMSRIMGIGPFWG